MWKLPCIACVGLIFFQCEGCFWFGCLPSLSSACAGHYPLDRGCAGAWPAHTIPGRQGQRLAPGRGSLSRGSWLHILLGRQGQWMALGCGTLGSCRRLHAPLGRWGQWLAPGHRTPGVGGLHILPGR